MTGLRAASALRFGGPNIDAVIPGRRGSGEPNSKRRIGHRGPGAAIGFVRHLDARPA
jgi:hypothetical protein